MNRREYLKLKAGALFSVAFAGSGVAKVNSKERPNLLVIMTDEHNFRTLGCYRKTLSKEQAEIWGEGNIVETPHIDALAEKGALCTNFYATSPVCSPARGSFMSGLYPQNTPVLNNDIPMGDEVTTFATILGEQGYATGYSGKWHLDGHGKPQWGPKRQFGFDDNRFMFNRGHWKVLEDTPEGPKVKTDKKGKPTYDISGATEKTFTTDWLADKTVEFIKKHKDEQFCYMVSIPDPHGPDKVRAPYDTMYKHMKFKKPHTANKSQEGVPSWARPKKGGADDSQYFGMIKCIDDNVKKIMDSLEENGVLENTVVVFTSDHGDLRGEHGRQNKGTVLEASAKVPFIVRYPEKVKPGSKVKEALGGVDFLPTILGLMEVPTNGKEEGRDASGLFVDNKEKGWTDVAVIRGTKSFNWVSAISERYKLVLSPQDEPWLIDKVRDPDELKNFCNNPEYRSIVRRLGKEMLNYHKAFNDPSVKVSKMTYDLNWAVGDTGAYDPSGAPKVKVEKTASSKKKKKKI
ncbi:MAG: sulfatase [Lentisphaerales bacterium]|nr:sulfatase [Lentisphaerales bacterium]